MPSTALFNIFSDKKQPKNGDTSHEHELALIKAAAWAWYQHTSGSEGKELREFDAMRTHQSPKPTRYKLEAMRLAQHHVHEEEEKGDQDSFDTNSLLDHYEIESITKQLDYLIRSSSNGKRAYPRFFSGDLRSQETTPSLNLSSSKSTRKDKKTNMNGFMKKLWSRHLAVCGSEEDIDPRALVNQVPVVKMVTCRPRHGRPRVSLLPCVLARNQV